MHPADFGREGAGRLGKDLDKGVRYARRPARRQVDQAPCRDRLSADLAVRAVNPHIAHEARPGTSSDPGSGLGLFPGQQRTPIVDLVPQNHPGPAALRLFRSSMAPVGRGHFLDPADIDDIVDVAVLVEIGVGGSMTWANTCRPGGGSRGSIGALDIPGQRSVGPAATGSGQTFIYINSLHPSTEPNTVKRQGIDTDTLKSAVCMLIVQIGLA